MVTPPSRKAQSLFGWLSQGGVASLFAVALALVLGMGLGGCAALIPTDPAEDEKMATTVACAELDLLKNVSDEDILAQVDMLDPSLGKTLSAWHIDPQELLSHLLKTYDYRVVQTSVNGDQATITAEVTVADISSAIDSAATVDDNDLLTTYGNAYRNNDASTIAKLAQDRMLAAIDDKDNRTTVDVEVYEHKVDGAWLVDDGCLDQITSVLCGLA